MLISFESTKEASLLWCLKFFVCIPQFQFVYSCACTGEHVRCSVFSGIRETGHILTPQGRGVKRA